MKKFFSAALLSTALILTGCGESTDIRFPVVDPPFAVNDNYSVDHDTTLTVAALTGVLANDITNDGTVVEFDQVSAQGATVNLAPDGAFNYTPVAGFSGSDNFTYTLGNGIGDSTATVTIQVNQTVVDGFFVDAVNGNDATGDFDGGLPFRTIQAAVTEAGINQDIIVRPGTYNESVTLLDGQRLLGSGSTLVNAQGENRPVISGGSITLANGNTVDFLRIEGTNGDAIVADGRNGGTVTNCEIASTTGGPTSSGLSGNNSRGAWDISNNSFSNLNGAGVVFRPSGADTATFTISSNSFTSNGLSGIILVSQDTSDVTAFVKSNTFTGNNTVTGNAFELECLGTSTFCLDLEDNINDDVYSLFDAADGTSRLRVEQFAGNGLTTAKPAGAGNTGTVTPLGDAPISVPNGFCTP